MGVPTSEVGYTPAMPRREGHEVHKDMWWHWTKKIPVVKYVEGIIINILFARKQICSLKQPGVEFFFHSELPM